MTANIYAQSSKSNLEKKNEKSLNLTLSDVWNKQTNKTERRIESATEIQYAQNYVGCTLKSYENYINWGWHVSWHPLTVITKG